MGHSHAPERSSPDPCLPQPSLPCGECERRPFPAAGSARRALPPCRARSRRDAPRCGGGEQSSGRRCSVLLAGCGGSRLPGHGRTRATTPECSVVLFFALASEPAPPWGRPRRDGSLGATKRVRVVAPVTAACLPLTPTPSTREQRAPVGSKPPSRECSCHSVSCPSWLISPLLSHATLNSLPTSAFCLFLG